MTSGYSATPLVKKLGIKANYKIILENEPTHYLDLLDVLPEGVREAEKGEHADFIHLFSKEKAHLKKSFPELKKRLEMTGMLWVSWPKKTSKIESDLDGNIVREMGLGFGLVDTKVCAVDEDWSGLKFMYRIKDRK